jgi:cyclic lactone autoinducer peptide
MEEILITEIAIGGASTASWAWINQPKTPDCLK